MTFADSYRSGPGGTSPLGGGTITGHGTTDLDPFATVAYSQVAGLGAITTFTNGSEVWEFGGGGYGSSSAWNASPGAPLSGFAPSVEGTLGAEWGPVAMLGLGSGSGYLDLVGSAITNASPAGAGQVGGVPVTDYRVTVDPTKLAQVPGLSADQHETVDEALSALGQDGYRSMTDQVAVDAHGYIRQITEVVTYNSSPAEELAITP
jgi:hypothetical protein